MSHPFGTTEGLHRFLDLLDFLVDLPPARFRFETMVSEYGPDGKPTCCCAAGWLPNVTDWWTWRTLNGQPSLCPSDRARVRCYADELSRYFSVEPYEADQLFMRGHSDGSVVTVSHWLRRAKTFLADCQVPTGKSKLVNPAKLAPRKLSKAGVAAWRARFPLTEPSNA